MASANQTPGGYNFAPIGASQQGRANQHDLACFGALMPKALTSSRKHPIHSFSWPPTISPNITHFSGSYRPCAPQIPQTRSASCVKSPMVQVEAASQTYKQVQPFSYLGGAVTETPDMSVENCQADPRMLDAHQVVPHRSSTTKIKSRSSSRPEC